MRIKYIIFILLVFSSINIFPQNGTRLIGFDAKTIGRGGTSIGLFDSPVLMMTNPAGISFLDKSFIEGNFSMMLPTLKFENTINAEKEGEKSIYPLPYAGYIQKLKKSNLTVGFGLFTNGGMGSDFMLNHNLFKDQSGNYVQQNYYSKFAVMQGGPAFAYKFSKNFSAGISAHLYYSMMDFKMPYSLSPSMLKGVVNPQTGMTFGDMFSAPQSQGGLGYTEVTAYAEMKDLSAFGFGGKIGLAYKFNEKVSIGLTYSLPVNLTYKNGTANMDMTYQMQDAFGRVVQGYMTNYPGITQQQATDSANNAFTQMGINMSLGAAASYELENKLSIPQSIGFGLSIAPNRQLRIAMDFEWINWKTAFEKMELSMTGGQNANVNRMMGNDGSFTMDFPMYWKDSYVIHGGLEYDVNKMFTLRAGYTYGTNPVPDSSVFPVFPAVVENHVMAGTTINFSKQFSTSLAFEMALNSKQTSTADNVVAEEYNNSISQLQTMLFHILLSYKF